MNNNMSQLDNHTTWHNSYNCSNGDENDNWPEKNDDKKSLHEDSQSDNDATTRTIVQTLRNTQSRQEISQILKAIDLLLEDSTPYVRIEVMEQLPLVANYLINDCIMPSAMSDYLLPIVLKGLTDLCIEVRKMSQATLIVLLMRNLVNKADKEDQICQVLIQMSEPDCGDDYRCEAITMMAKISQQLEEEIAQKFILPRFEELCVDSSFQVRKTCAEYIDDVSYAIGSIKTQEILLPIFIKLCRDEVWGVRKACADNMLAVSFAVSLRSRHEVLTSIFVDLLHDKSKWVRMGAYKSLGQFMFSFVDSEDSNYTTNATTDLARKICPDVDISNNYGGISTIDPVDTGTVNGLFNGQMPIRSLGEINSSSHNDIDLITTKSLDEIVNELAAMTIDGTETELDNKIISTALAARSRASSVNSSCVSLTEYEASLPSRKIIDHGQDVVPQVLLDNYLAMVKPELIENVDAQLPYYCAYNLPAVTLALGGRYWHYLKRVYSSLVANPQGKVRRTLAYSIFDMALILGEDTTLKDLVPAFNEFMQDPSEEVRIGLLKHLNTFIRLLPYQIQIQYLPLLKGFIRSYSSNKWRMRFDYIEQLISLSELYPAAELYTFFCPVALNLAADPTAAVRNQAYSLICQLMITLKECEDPVLWDDFGKEIIKSFANGQHWLRRQAFTHLCQSLLENEAENPEDFAARFLPDLLELAKDAVPNVRLGVARILSQTIPKFDYYLHPPHDDDFNQNLLITTLTNLANDPDPDVQYYATSFIDQN